MSSPLTEHKYICPHCHYSALVAGKRFFESELDLYLETRKCNNCNRLFDNEVTLKATEEARKVQIDDLVIIVSYASMDFEEAKTHKPIVVFPQENKLS